MIKAVIDTNMLVAALLTPLEILQDYLIMC